MLNFLNWQQRPLRLKAHRFAQSAEGALHRIGFVRLAVGLVAVGVIGRLVRYFLRFPIWGDEAFVCLNFLHRDFAGLTHSLEYAQIVPILFLWAELVVTRLLGVSELALRLLPFLAGLAALGLFWRLAWSTLPPLAAVFAVGLLIVLDVVRPYRDMETPWMKQSAGAILGRLKPDDQLVILQDPSSLEPTFRWYLESRYRGVRWQIDWDRLATKDNQLVTVNCWKHLVNEASVPPRFDEPAAHGWTTIEQSSDAIRSSDGEWTFHIEMRRWAPR